MKGPLQLLTVLGVFLLIGRTAAQAPELTPVPMQYKDNPSSIAGMIQDTQGYIWFADITLGLFRFDGVDLVHYRHEQNNPNSLSSDRLECIAAAPDGTIWIGAFQDGLTHFDPLKESFVTYRHDSSDQKSIRSDHIRALVVDSSGGVWIGTREGVDYYDPQTGTFRHRLTSDPDEELLQNEHVRSLYLDRQGIVWVGCGSSFFSEETTGGLFKIDIQNNSIDHYVQTAADNSLIDNRVEAIFEDSRGTFWVGTAGDGLHTMNKEKGTFIRHQYDSNHPEKLSRPPVGNMHNYAEDHITFIQEDQQGFIWIGTFQNGINRYDPVKKTVQHFGTQEEGIYRLPRDDFWSAIATRDGLLWFGGWVSRSPNDQLLKMNPDPKKMTVVTLGGPVRRFAEDHSKNIYMGSNDLVLRLNPDGILDTILRLNEYHEGNPHVRYLEADPAGNLWISSEGGLFKYRIDAKSLQVFRAEQGTGLEHNFIRCTYKLNKDSLLVGANPGLYLLDLKQNRFTKYGWQDNQPNLPLIVSKILIDARKNIWIATSNNGILRLALPSGNLIPYRLNDVTEEQTFDLFEDSAGDVYIGTWRSGFRKYNPKNDRFEYVEDVSGLINEETEIYSIHSEGKDRLWLEGRNGIIKYDLKTKKSSIYGRSWGFYPLDIAQNGFFRSSAGEYFKGTLTGYLKFHPADLEEQNEAQTNLFIGKLLADNQLIDLSQEQNGPIQLNYKQNNLSLELGFINFLSDASDQLLQYQLDGFDDAWRNGGNGERVNYYKIPPGAYQFRLRGMDLYGNWDETSLAIVISPPWYKTWWAYSFYLLCFITGLFSFDRYQRKRIAERERAKSRTRELAQAREIEKAYKELGVAYEHLKATQAQLIQSEKLASLGELTAGIAHEIQNPINFVNNFSELSIDLADELKAEMGKLPIPEKDKDYFGELLSDLTQNQQKIHHHGQRAASIVTGMLQHARSGTGTKTPTDLNALADEYLRLAYHGLRAKDSSFNAKMETELDPAIGKVEVIAQDIGRVFLNIINNAFYATQERKNQGENDYEPTISLSSRKENGSVVFKIKDNGSGIPEEVKAKIFQPFFTTKPTGQGTGLGLSLAYDIVVKGHGGTLDVETKEGEGTEFIIRLPLQNSQNEDL